MLSAPGPERLFGGGEGRGLRRDEDGGGLFGDVGAHEETRVLRAPQFDRVRKGKGAESSLVM